MKSVASTFFQFAGIHSFLIGMLPFFIPVLLLQRGVTIEGIALFIAVTGLSFIVSLKVWQALYNRREWWLIISASFVVELMLVVALLYTDSTAFIFIAALLNGAYNCFYWTTQRVLFSTMTTSAHEPKLSSQSQMTATTHNINPTTHQTGRQYGNFQILVVVMLKLGIILGAFMLEADTRSLLWIVSALISLAAIIFFSQSNKRRVFSKANVIMQIDAAVEKPTKVSLFCFKDQQNSAVIFYLDGIFLFLESYFWVISLFLISQQSIKELGIIIVLLTVFLSVIFYLLKNRIDKLEQNKVYITAVFLYAVSWILRSELNPDLPNYLLYSGILLIAFLTTLFRLSFNKRFFDNAKEYHPLNYLLAKSYLSQMGILIFYSCVALFASYFADIQTSLSALYLVLTPISLIYLVYKYPAKDVIPTVSVTGNRLNTLSESL